jgi:spermidine/putrescine transport system substrate-binding protein
MARKRSSNETGRLNRRDFMVMSAGAGLGLGIFGTACGGDDGDANAGASTTAGGATTSGATAGGDLEPDGDLVYFNYAQYLDPAALEGFADEYGVEVIENNFDTYDAMFAKLQQESYDIVVPSGDWVAKLISAGLLAEVGAADLSNASNIEPFFMSPWYDPDFQYSAPYNFYKSGLLVRTTDLDGVEVTSWSDMGNPELAGLVFMFDDVAAGIALGLQLAGRSINSIDDDDIEAAKQELVAIKGNLGGFTADFNQPIISGEGAVVYSYNGAAVQVRAQVDDPENIKWIDPAPGPLFATDAFVIPANAAHPNTARLFIDYMLRPEVSAANVAFNGYPMGTVSGLAAFSELVVDDPAISVTVADLEKAKEEDRFIFDIGDEGREKWSAAWTEVKTA